MEDIKKVSSQLAVICSNSKLQWQKCQHWTIGNQHLDEEKNAQQLAGSNGNSNGANS